MCILLWGIAVPPITQLPAGLDAGVVMACFGDVWAGGRSMVSEPAPNLRLSRVSFSCCVAHAAYYVGWYPAFLLGDRDAECDRQLKAPIITGTGLVSPMPCRAVAVN